MASDNLSAEKFFNIFMGRKDAYGGDTGRAIYETVDTNLIASHLDGTHEPIGIYPVRFVAVGQHVNSWKGSQQAQMDVMRVRWGCCDIDTGETDAKQGWDETYRLAKALQAMGLQPWVERSRSKGWHVWIFVPTSVAAYEMRRCLKVAYSAINLPAKEANPKSELLKPNQLGNYVRLPYPSAYNPIGPAAERQVMMKHWSADSDGFPMHVNEFLENDVYSDPDKVRFWADKWHEPPRPTFVRDEEISDEKKLQLIDMMPRPQKALFDNGPKNGDTSQGLMALAHNLAQKGWTPENVYSIVELADHRWGKYALTRNDPETYYTDIVERAYR